jgi:hypothetical protein
VYAREVEEVLLAVEGVRDAAVIGLPDRVWGEVVTAVLVPAGASRDSAGVVDACRRALPGYRVPKRVYWLDELPRNAYGKVLKRQLREEVARQDAPAVAGSRAASALTIPSGPSNAPPSGTESRWLPITNPGRPPTPPRPARPTTPRDSPHGRW